MGIGSIISWMVCGLIVGLIARLLVPGRQNMGLIMTMITGIAGALVGGFLYSMIRGPAVRPFAMDQDNWYGWIVSILGAMLLVWVSPKVFRRT
jgi:uncharacterized membrane protein YeaQ/YmgE (transglycosylase-associated protein family)